MVDLVESNAVRAINKVLMDYNYGKTTFINVRDMIMSHREFHNGILITVYLMEPHRLCASVCAFDPPNALIFSCGNGQIFHLERKSDLDSVLKILETRVFAHPSFGNLLISPNIAGLKKTKRLAFMKECKCDEVYQRLFPLLYKEDIEL